MCRSIKNNLNNLLSPLGEDIVISNMVLIRSQKIERNISHFIIFQIFYICHFGIVLPDTSFNVFTMDALLGSSQYIQVDVDSFFDTNATNNEQRIR